MLAVEMLVLHQLVRCVLVLVLMKHLWLQRRIGHGFGFGRGIHAWDVGGLRGGGVRVGIGIVGGVESVDRVHPTVIHHHHRSSILWERLSVVRVGVEGREVQTELEEAGKFVIAGLGDHGIFMETVRPGRVGGLIHCSERLTRVKSERRPSGSVGVWRGRRWLRRLNGRINIAGGRP